MLDLRTMYFMLTLTAITAGLCVMALPPPNAERKRSAQIWATGSFFIAFGLLLIGLRDVIALWASVVLGNGFLLSGLLLFNVAVAEILGRPAARIKVFAVCAGFFLLFHCLLIAGVDSRFRVALVSAFFCVLAVIMIRGVRQSQSLHTQKARVLMQAVYGVVLLTAAIRCLHTLFFAPSAMHVFEPNWTQVLSFMCLFLAMIGAAINYIFMQTALAYRDLEQIANHDALTGVRSRRNFMEMAIRDRAMAERMQRSFSVVMLDLDNFKRINDEFGHLVGDEALACFGQILRNALRDVDLIGRYGGEEFCLALTDSHPDFAITAAERIRSRVEAHELVRHGKRVPLTVSIGLAGMTASTPRTLEALLHSADQALYAAKNAGRNCIKRESDLGPAP